MNTLPVNCSQCGIEFQKYIPYIKQGEKRGCPNHFCSNKCSVLFNRERQTKNKNTRIEEYYKNPKLCLNCNNIIEYKNKSWKKYCSQKCGAIHTQKDGGHQHWSKESKKKLSEWAKKYAYRPTPSSIKIKKSCIFCKNIFKIIPSQQHRLCCSRKCYCKWIKTAGYMKGKTGGFRSNSGTSKKGWYKGYFCGSSWELAWLIYQLDHNISVKRNKEGFNYNFKDKIKKYYPDFIVDDEYIEIKNYETEQVIEKTKQFPYKLKLLYKKDLTDIFNYVEQKYGKNYIRLSSMI
jgi:hypothetical protein